jgi:hypothetical protein
MCINDTMVMLAYEASLIFPVKDLLKLDVMEVITNEVNKNITLQKAGVRR